MQVILTVETGRNQGHRKWIRSGEELSIGASAWADLVVESPEVLPIHVLVQLSDDGCSLRCVNGGEVVVNGQSQTRTTLAHNDRIQLGRVVLRSEFHGVDIAEPPTPHFTPSIAPLNEGESKLIAPIPVRSADFDSDFICYEPGEESDFIADAFIARLDMLAPVWLLCRFDRWTFPAPEYLQDCCDSVPASSDPQARVYLPILFRWEPDKLTAELLKQGLDSQNLMILASRLAKDDLLSFLRSQGGLFLSPEAMQAVIPEMQDGALEPMLGPIEAVVLGKAQAWQCYARRQLVKGTDNLLCVSMERTA